MWTFGANLASSAYVPPYLYNQKPLNPGVKELAFAVDIGQAHLLSYVPPYGNTPLFDAVGNAISRLKEHRHETNTSLLIQVITDGEENVSQKYDAALVARMIADCQKEGTWTFVFHLPPGKKAAFCSRFGVPEGNCREWERTTVGLQDLAIKTSASTRSYYSGVTRGKVATAGFFTADLSKVKASDVKRKLLDVSGSFKSYTVAKESAIKEFVEDVAKQPYRLGDAFYLLTKDERIQSNKKILVKEKGKPAVYYGDDARSVLGLPLATINSDLKIRPGNMANYDVFIQSTSTNRKLVRGTSVLLLKAGETL
jgi:hypothetical protein